MSDVRVPVSACICPYIMQTPAKDITQSMCHKNILPQSKLQKL